MNVLPYPDPRRLVLLLPFLAAFAGCGGSGNLATVTGKVTLDGQPLPEALLLFSPTAGGSPSAGRTDPDGRFTLVYSRTEQGAEFGEHQVWISTGQPADEDAHPPRPAQPEKVPENYRRGTALKADVKPGRNTINFELVSGDSTPTNFR